MSYLTPPASSSSFSSSSSSSSMGAPGVQGGGGVGGVQPSLTAASSSARRGNHSASSSSRSSGRTDPVASESTSLLSKRDNNSSSSRGRDIVVSYDALESLQSKRFGSFKLLSMIVDNITRSEKSSSTRLADTANTSRAKIDMFYGRIASYLDHISKARFCIAGKTVYASIQADSSKVFAVSLQPSIILDKLRRTSARRKLDIESMRDTTSQNIGNDLSESTTAPGVDEESQLASAPGAVHFQYSPILPSNSEVVIGLSPQGNRRDMDAADNEPGSPTLNMKLFMVLVLIIIVVIAVAVLF
jgi:hypothetical protein